MSCLVHEGKIAELIWIVCLDWLDGRGLHHLFFTPVYRDWGS